MHYLINVIIISLLINTKTFNTAYSQEFPTHNIRLIVPFATGGSTDIFARLVGQNLSDAFKQPVIIDNKTGAGGNLAATLASKAIPDGYTIFFAGSPFIINANLYGSLLPYNPIKDFAPITLIAKAPQVITTHPSLPVKNINELINLSKLNPGKISYGTGGVGTSNHLVGELLKAAAAIDIIHVPFKGGVGPAIAVMSGEIELIVSGPPTVLPFIKTGRLKAIAVTSNNRSSILPNVKTMIESGYKNFEINTWYCIVAPSGTSKDIIEKIRFTLIKAMEVPLVQRRLMDEGAISAYSTPEELGKFLLSELEIWGKAVKLSGAKIE